MYICSHVQIFRQAPRLPYEVKAQILADSKSRAAEPEESISSAKAAFQVALACLSGFGGTQDSVEALHWIAISASKGLELASIFSSFFETHTGTQTTPTALQSHSTECFQQALRKSPVCRSRGPSTFDSFPAVYGIDSTTISELDAKET